MTRIFCLVFFLLTGMGGVFAFTITEGPLFKSSTVGSLYLPCFDDSNLYAYRIDREGLCLMVLDLHTLAPKRELMWLRDSIGLGDDIVDFSRSSQGNRVHITVTNVIKKEWKYVYWSADFEIDKVKALSDIHFSKVEKQMEQPVYALPEYEDISGWTVWLNHDGTAYYWGVTIDPLTAVLVKADTETGKISQVYEMEMKNDYKNWSRSFRFPQYISGLVETEDGVYVLMHSEIISSGSSSFSGGSVYYDSYIYTGCWLFKMSKQKDKQWDIMLPITQKLNEYKDMTARGYRNFTKGVLAEGKDNFYFFYNDDKDNHPTQTNMYMKMDVLTPAEADDGILAAITISKTTGDWIREAAYVNKTTGSFFNCKDGIQISENEFVFPVDLPKKNSGRLVKISF